MLNLLQKLRMISGRKIIAVLCACALTAPTANPAAAYDQICFKQHSAYTTNGISLRKVGENNPEAIVWSQHFKPYVTWGLRKCVDVRGRMSPGDPFNIVQDINSGPDRRCHADGGRGDGTYRWPAGGGTMELGGHGTSGHGRCNVAEYKMWSGCEDDSRGGFSQLGCQDWHPEAHKFAAFDYVQQSTNVAYLRSVLRRGSDPNAGRYGDETPLHVAVRFWRKDHIDALLEAGANPLLRDSEGETVVWAMFDGQRRRNDFLQVFRKMIQGDERRMINEGLRGGGVPAMINVVLSRDASMVEFALEQGGNAGETTHSRYSPLHHAAKVSLRMVRLLLDRGANPNVFTRDGYGTPLHWAVDPRFARKPLLDGNRGDMVAAMVEAGGNPNMTNGGGQTPLHYAAQLGDALAVGSMLNHDGNPNLADAGGLTVLHYAAAAGHLHTVEQLVRRGADLSLEDHYGNTAEELAKTEEVRLALMRMRTKETEPDPAVLETDAGGRTVLHHSAARGDLAAMGEALEKGADVNARDRRRQTPLHYAARSRDGGANGLRLLLEHDADPDLRSVSGETALHMAVYHSAEAVRVLLEGGANPDIEDNRGRTARDVAAQGNRADVLAILNR